MGKKNPFKSLSLRPTPSSPNLSTPPATVPSAIHTVTHERLLTSRDVQQAYRRRQNVRSTGSGVYSLSRGRHAQSESALPNPDATGPSTSRQSSCDRSSPERGPSQRSSSPQYGASSPGGGWSSDYHHVSQPESNHAHCRSTRSNQFIKWTKVVIPSLIQPYLALSRRTENLGDVDRQFSSACSCKHTNARALSITCVYFDSGYI